MSMFDKLSKTASGLLNSKDAKKMMDEVSKMASGKKTETKEDEKATEDAAPKVDKTAETTPVSAETDTTTTAASAGEPTVVTTSVADPAGTDTGVGVAATPGDGSQETTPNMKGVEAALPDAQDTAPKVEGTEAATPGTEAATPGTEADATEEEKDKAAQSTLDSMMAKAKDPKVQGTLMKASKSRKLKRAIADIQKNGFSAIPKYMTDREIMGIVNDLKHIF